VTLRPKALLLALGGMLVCLQTLSPTTQLETPPVRNFILEGDRLYFEGRHLEAIRSYQQAIRRSPRTLDAYLNGAVVWSDLGKARMAAKWYRKAVELDPGDARLRTALAEAEFRHGNLEAATLEADAALALDPEEPYALVLKGLLELARHRPEEALEPLSAAARLRPQLTLAHFWLGRALEGAGDDSGAARAYAQAAARDSYFTQARYQLTRAFARQGRFREAWEQSRKLIDTAPFHRHYRLLEAAARALVSRGPRAPALKDALAPQTPARLPWKGGWNREPASADGAAITPEEAAAMQASAAQPRRPVAALTPPAGRIPRLRVGIGTTAMGKPLAWKALSFSCSTRFSIVSALTGAVMVSGRAGEKWTVTVLRAHGGPRIQAMDPSGEAVLDSATPIILRPDGLRGGWTRLRQVPEGTAPGDPPASRTLRGDIELAPHPDRPGLKVVNVVDLESYTHGVLSAEMPIGSPMEALRAQAVIARTHALYMRFRPRHAADGYHLCDGQHCQVYQGVASETPRSREVVSGTLGRVVTLHGKLAHVLYSASCGGHTQSSSEVKGWGDAPHFTGTPDSDTSQPPPSSPWGLRQWLRGSPGAYCATAAVQASHFRWTRVVPAEEIGDRVNRRLGIGRLVGIVPLRRSASGHLNSVLVRGSLGSRVIDSEMGIRSLLGVGSQRSSLFVVDAENDSQGNPKAFVFYGGGWGHGVGLCQSGAIGRAERGQSYAEILRAYFRGIELGSLVY